MEGLSREFKAGRVSLYLAMACMAVAGIPSHGYTMIAFIVFLAVCGVIWYIRTVSKSTQDQHRAWIAGGAVLIVEIQQQWSPDHGFMLTFMMWHTIILAAALIIMHFVAKAEVSYSTRATVATA